MLNRNILSIFFDMDLIQKFNHQDTFLIISDYPEVTKQGEKNYGMAWYTKATIEPLAKKYKRCFVVLAENGNNDKPKLYQNGRILVLRIFNQKRPTLFPRILKWLIVFNKIKHIYVHSEFGANGGIKNFALLIPFLLLIKLNGIKITFFAHNVVENFDLLAPHLNIKKGSLKIKIYNIFLRVYNFSLGYVVDQVVVLDPAIKKRINKYINKNKIIVTLIPVKERKHQLSKRRGKAKLGIKNNEFVLLYFGFISHYKGADWLLSQVLEMNGKIGKKKIKLILARGPAYSLKNKKYYQKYYQQQLETANKDPRITITDFVPETEVEKYFTAADLVIFPYRGMIGASGALTHALSYHKPFVVSRGLNPLLESNDFQKGLKKLGLDKKDIIFNLDRNSFSRLLKKSQNKNQLTKLSKLSAFVARQRAFNNWSSDYFDRVYERKLKSKASFLHGLAGYVCPQLKNQLS